MLLQLASTYKNLCNLTILKKIVLSLIYIVELSVLISLKNCYILTFKTHRFLLSFLYLRFIQKSHIQS